MFVELAIEKYIRAFKNKELTGDEDTDTLLQNSYQHNNYTFKEFLASVIQNRFNEEFLFKSVWEQIVDD